MEAIRKQYENVEGVVAIIGTGKIAKAEFLRQCYK